MIAKKVELLSPAKNLTCGLEAINHGADAVYIGASNFGARATAGNSIRDIEQLVTYAHAYGAKVYVTLNTILYDDELPQAQKLIVQLYEAGVDALIVQDMALLQLDIPPIALHASTQTDNRTAEKVAFLHQSGFERVVLARELSIAQIASIHQAVPVELEAFVHGALCVSYSGQCYMSQANCGRSANRGACAQYCRLPYTLQDTNGKVLVSNKHLLSLKDMNRSNLLREMIDAGVMSFKIEGRLKDVSYVKNITAYYRQQLDAILESDNSLHRTSVGKSSFFFTPNPYKSFNRGTTDYFAHSRTTNMAQLHTPKSMGEMLGEVTLVGRNFVEINTPLTPNNGDGICYIDQRSGEFTGFRINRAEGTRLFANHMPPINKSTVLYRNFDQEFERTLERKSAERRIAVDIHFEEQDKGFSITLCDEEGCSITQQFEAEKQLAQKVGQAHDMLTQQLQKLGDTIFSPRSLTICCTNTYFFPSSLLAQWRKKAFEQLHQERLAMHAPQPSTLTRTHVPLQRSSTYRDNISNHLAAQFYQHCGMSTDEPAFEISPKKNAILMQCKYCIKHELGWCKKQGGNPPAYKEPLLLNYKGKLFKLQFNCTTCEMSICSL